MAIKQASVVPAGAWQGDPYSQGVAMGLLASAASEGNLAMLGAYVAELRGRGVNLEPIYASVRRKYPSIPPLATLEVPSRA